jgi:hypothetical protein
MSASLIGRSRLSAFRLSTCRFQKLDSRVAVMQSAQDCMGDDIPDAFDRAPVRRILSEQNMRRLPAFGLHRDPAVRQPGQGRRGRAHSACRLLRGRSLRPFCRQTPAERGGMGGSARRRDRRCLWASLAMDAQCLSTLSVLPRGQRGARRIERQVHGQPNGAAGLFARDTARA